MKYLLTLCMGFFMLLSCNNKSSQSAAIATDEPEVNEDTLFRVIDLANNLKPCSDSLLLSDIVEDVEYVKLETADNYSPHHTYSKEGGCGICKTGDGRQWSGWSNE